jgi:hypothetical protein
MVKQNCAIDQKRLTLYELQRTENQYFKRT